MTDLNLEIQDMYLVYVLYLVRITVNDWMSLRSLT